jgi:cell division protease FtsH
MEFLDAGALLPGQPEPVAQLQDMDRPRIAIELRRQCEAHAPTGPQIADLLVGQSLHGTALHPGVDPVHKVSIIPRGVGALGYTIQRPTEDRFLMTREELENKMAVLLGGRAAELIVFNHLSTGASDDLVRVTDIARSMVTRYGMSDKLGNVALEKDGRSFLSPNPLANGAQERSYSDETASAIDDEVRAIVDRVFERTVALLRERRDVLERTARRLLEKETLDEAELQQLVGAAPAERPSLVVEIDRDHRGRGGRATSGSDHT